MGVRSVTLVECDSAECRKTVDVPTDRHTDDRPALPGTWRYLDLGWGMDKHRGQGAQFVVCSQGCGERVLSKAMREMYDGYPTEVPIREPIGAT